MEPASPSAPRGALCLARSETFDLAHPGGALRFCLCWPEEAPPATGYGLICTPDAGWSLGTLRDLLHLRGAAEAASGIGPTLLLGFGYPTPDLTDISRREADLARTHRAETLRLLTETALPRVAARFPLDRGRVMLLGHSYGGAFALRAGFAPGTPFSHIAAGSPSLWTAPEVIFSEAEAAVPAPGPALLMTAGEREDPSIAEACGAPADRVERLRQRDVIGRARALAGMRNARFLLFPGCDHGAALLPFLAEATAFLWEERRLRTAPSGKATGR